MRGQRPKSAPRRIQRVGEAGDGLRPAARVAKAGGNPLWNHYYCCEDGRWICLSMLQPDRHWADFCRALERPELATDERFVDLRARAQNAEAAIEILDEAFASKPCDEWIDILLRAGLP